MGGIMNELEQDYLKHGRFMTARQRNQSIESVHLEQALRQIKRIESEGGTVGFKNGNGPTM